MDELEQAARLVKSAKQVAALGCVMVIIASVVTMIDMGIKRAILAESEQARKRQADLSTREAVISDGATDARQAGGVPDAGDDADRELVHDAAAAAVLDPATEPAAAAPRQRKARVASGPQGDG